MPVVTSQILKSVDFTKTQNSRYVKNKALFFLQINKLINYLSRATLWKKKSFVAVVTSKYRDHQWDLQTIWKTRLRHILKSWGSMYESSGSQFFRTTTRIQSRADIFDESRFIMTFLTIVGVIEILWSSRLALESKIGR